jgi:hypothetical protein
MVNVVYAGPAEGLILCTDGQNGHSFLSFFLQAFIPVSKIKNSKEESDRMTFEFKLKPIIPCFESTWLLLRHFQIFGSDDLKSMRQSLNNKIFHTVIFVITSHDPALGNKFRLYELIVKKIDA